MKKEISPEERLQASLNRINRVFYRMQKEKISVKKGKGMSDSTVKTYRDLMSSVMKQVYAETGKADITKVNENDIVRILQKRVEKYKNGSGKESYNIKTIRSAVKAFAKGAEETGVFKKPLRFDGKKIDSLIANEKIVRKSKHSSNLKATEKQAEKVIKNIETQGYQTKNRKIAAAVLRCATYSGGRVSAALKLRPEDIIENPSDGSVTVWYFDDKGGLDHKVIVFNEEHANFFKDLKASGVPGQEILKAQRKDKTFRSTDGLKKEVAKIIKAAGKEFDREVSVRERKDGKRVTTKVKVNFTVHSGRKAFINERVKLCWDKLKAESFEDIVKKERPEEYHKIMAKYKAELERINSNVYGKTKQTELNREQASMLLCSIDSAHYRNNILRNFYLDMPSFKKYQKENP